MPESGESRKVFVTHPLAEGREAGSSKRRRPAGTGRRREPVRRQAAGKLPSSRRKQAGPAFPRPRPHQRTKTFQDHSVGLLLSDQRSPAAAPSRLPVGDPPSLARPPLLRFGSARRRFPGNTGPIMPTSASVRWRGPTGRRPELSRKPRKPLKTGSLSSSPRRNQSPSPQNRTAIRVLLAHPASAGRP